MSGYFGALLRSAGLAPPPVQPATPPQLTVLEVEQVADEAPSPTRTPQDALAPPTPTPAAVRLESFTAASGRAASAVSQAVARGPALPATAAAVQRSPTAAPQSANEATDAVKPRAAVPQVTQPESAAPPASGRTPIQAAMQWVAAGRAVAPSPGPTMPARPLSGEPAARPAPTQPAQEVRLERAPLREVAQTIAQPVPPARPAPAAPPADQELLEISIGTIQLRVEAPLAPATQAVPQPQQAPAPPAQPVRNGLSRRSLRRI